MIKVDNSPEKRIFHLQEYSHKIKFKELKQKIIEFITKKQYTKLIILNGEEYSDQFSLYIFYNAIQAKLDLISNSHIKRKLKSLNWFRILVGDIFEIREEIKKNKTILANKSLPDFSNYQTIFENLYNSQLSGKAHLKKEFFNIFENINVCPYCNRNFINPIYKDFSYGGDYTKWSPDVEHFFPKSIYPFLSLSISNLLPSCSFCNKIKHDFDTYNKNCVSPYEVNKDEFTFDFELEDSVSKKITLISKNKYTNSDILNLENLYNDVHKNYINEIFDDILKYPESYKESFKKFNISEDEYKRTFRTYYKEEDFNKHPLSKMTKDLMLELKKYSN